MAPDFDIPGRIKCGTVACPDLAASLADYTGALGLAIVDDAPVPPALAAAWGAPAMAGRRSVLLAHPGASPCFLRLVAATPVPGFAALRSHGWAAFELSVIDGPALHQRLQGSGFSVLGPPRRLPGFDAFIPFQVAGRAGEVLYLNQVLDPVLPGLDLPMAAAAVDAMFIAVLAAPDREAAVGFHRDALGFAQGSSFSLPVSVLNTSFRQPAETPTTMTMTQTGRLPACEIDQYPAAATPRQRRPGELVPGNAMVSFITASLDVIGAAFVAPPQAFAGPPYYGRRAAIVIGPAGEAIEFIAAD